MNFVKLNKKHLFSFLLTLVLLFSLSLNSFATSSGLFNFYNSNFVAFANIDGKSTNVTDKVTKSRSDKLADNGRNYTTYMFYFPQQASYMSLNTGADLDLYSNTEYQYDFQFQILSSSHTCGITITLFVDDVSNDDNDTLYQLYNADNFNGGQWVNVSGKFKTPDINGTCRYAMLVQISDNDGSFSTLVNNTFYITDMSYSAIGPLYGKPITTPDSSELDDTLNEYEDVMNTLPDMDDIDIDSIFNGFDFSSFTDGMAFVREMFDRTMSVFGFNAVLVFALTIGLATYIIGRKVG